MSGYPGAVVKATSKNNPPLQVAIVVISTSRRLIRNMPARSSGNTARDNAATPKAAAITDTPRRHCPATTIPIPITVAATTAR